MVGLIILLFGGLAAYQYDLQTGAITSWLTQNFPPQPTPNRNTGSNVTVTQPEVSLYPHSERDLDIMARTLWGEARGEGYRGMKAVANVIMNRYASNNWPDNVADVCLQPFQFSAWLDSDPNKALMERVTTDNPDFRTALGIARLALTRQLADITGGADHYLNIPVTRQIRGDGTLPDWVDVNRKTAEIGVHTFLRLT